MANMKEFMSQEKPVSRWLIAKVFTAGVFCGAVLAVLYTWLAMVK